MNGANFGLFYAFVWGKQGSCRKAAWWGTVWLLIVELGMITLPPMGLMTGLFGTSFSWPGLFLVTLVAHVLTGLTVGPLTELWLTDDRSWSCPSSSDDRPRRRGTDRDPRPPETEMHADKWGPLGSVFTALCCLGVAPVIDALSAVGLGFLVNDLILIPLLVLFLGVTI